MQSERHRQCHENLIPFSRCCCGFLHGTTWLLFSIFWLRHLFWLGTIFARLFWFVRIGSTVLLFSNPSFRLLRLVLLRYSFWTRAGFAGCFCWSVRRRFCPSSFSFYTIRSPLSNWRKKKRSKTVTKYGKANMNPRLAKQQGPISDLIQRALRHRTGVIDFWDVYRENILFVLGTFTFNFISLTCAIWDLLCC